MTNASQPSGTTSYQYTGDGLVAAATTSPSWKTPTQNDPGKTITGVSCTTESACVEVDGAGNALTYNGESWSTATNIDGTNAIAAVSCATTTFCVAVDGKGNALTYNGTTWSSATVIDAHNALSAVSCPSVSFCAAADTTGNVLTYNGTTWSSAANVDGRNSINGISCASSTFCVAVDAKGNALTYNGTTWSTAASIDSTRVLKSISCPTTSFCAAVDASGYALIRTGTTWSTPSNIDGTTSLNAVACVSANWCDAVDNTGHALHYDGTAWSAPVSIDSGRVIKSVACASTRFCATGDATGYAILYQGPATQLTWNTAAPLPLVVSDGSYHYIYGPSTTPVEQVRESSGTVTFLTYTPTDSSWLATNTAGDQTGFWRYDAYGTLAYGNPVSAFGYAGEYSDTTTGYSNLRARWYAPAAGTFTTRDPAFESTDTAYTYGGGDPVNHTDPSGDADCVPDWTGNCPVPAGLPPLVGTAMAQVRSDVADAGYDWQYLTKQLFTDNVGLLLGVPDDAHRELVFDAEMYEFGFDMYNFYSVYAPGTPIEVHYDEMYNIFQNKLARDLAAAAITLEQNFENVTGFGGLLSALLKSLDQVTIFNLADYPSECPGPSRILQT